MAQNPVSLPDESYVELEKLVFGIVSTSGRRSRASGPFIDKERYEAFISIADHGLKTAPTSGGQFYGLRIAMQFKWRETAMSLARTIAERAANGDYAVQYDEMGPNGKPTLNTSGAGTFLAAHAFLIWGDASDAAFITNLLDESHEKKVVSFAGGFDTDFYAVADMASMAAAKVAGKSPRRGRPRTRR